VTKKLDHFHCTHPAIVDEMTVLKVFDCITD